MNPDKFKYITGYQFNNSEYLEKALTHRSVSRLNNNERLEFLGDSILNLSISDYIYQQFPKSDEGELSRIRASLVKEKTLAVVAKGIGLGDYIHLGGGELKSGGYRRDSILSDALEAVIAAVYLDSDFPTTSKMVIHLFDHQLSNIPADSSLKDPKTRLQEQLQSKQHELAVYKVDQTTGKSHNQIFHVSCRLDAMNLISQGSGTSRKKAEQLAASKMLEKLLK